MMGNGDLRVAIATGWLVRQLAMVTHRTEAQIAADLFAYMDEIDAELERRGETHGG